MTDTDTPVQKMKTSRELVGNVLFSETANLDQTYITRSFSGLMILANSAGRPEAVA